MTFSTSTIATELPKEVLRSLLIAVDTGTKQFVRIVWSAVTTFLFNHWLSVIGVFLVTLLFFVLRAILGNWGSLYSLTYNTLYVGIVFVVGLIWGPEVLVSDMFHIIYMLVIYPICFLLTAWIWDRFGFR